MKKKNILCKLITYGKLPRTHDKIYVFVKIKATDTFKIKIEIKRRSGLQGKQTTNMTTTRCKPSILETWTNCTGVISNITTFLSTKNSFI